MNWNRKNPRFRRSKLKSLAAKPRPKPHRGHRQGFLARFSGKLSGLLGGFTKQTASPPVEKKAPAPPPQSAASEDLFADLKIAVPKSRRYGGACSPKNKPKVGTRTEAERRETAAEVMDAVNASLIAEDLDMECDDMVDPLDLIDSPREAAPPPPEEPPAPAPEAEKPLPPPSEQFVSGETAETERPKLPPPGDIPASAGREKRDLSPEAGRNGTLRKTGAVEQPAARPVTPGDDRRSADKTGLKASREKPAEAETVPSQKVSEPDHIKSNGKKNADRNRSARRPKSETPKKSRRILWLIVILALVLGGLGLGFLYFPGQWTPVAKVARIPAANLPKIAPLAPGFYELYAREREAAIRSEVTIKPGSSLGQALEEMGIGVRHGAPAIIDSLMGEGGLGVVRPGAVVKSYWADRGRTSLARLEYYPSSGDAPMVVLPKADGGFMRYSLATLPLTISMAREGVITSSLWEAGAKAGLDANVILRITDILASEVDFFTDIKQDDAFQVLYSRDYSDGRPQGLPVIDMVKLTNKGRELEYYRFINSAGVEGYYDPEGRSSIKTFFVTPLQYRRISSHFSMARKHPIYKVVRPHQGVDYAAPSGTPVSAVADGTVIFCGHSGGYGRLVTIKHNDTYTTMYAHLSKFAPGLKKGSVVKQGDLIGNVGASGTATGPHLDFRLKKNGVFIDPIPELAKQQGKKLDNKDELQAFATVVGQVRERMKQLLAANHEE